MPTYADVEKLIYRVSRIIQKREKLAIVIGSGVTLPCNGHKGVASAGEIATLIGSRFDDADGQEMFHRATNGRGNSDKYQQAMRLLAECEGQEAVNDVITEAVLEACNASSKGKDAAELVKLEEDYRSWNINQALEAVANLYKAFPQSIGPILTSNFDPLIGISIKRIEPQFEVLPLPADGRFLPFDAEKVNRHVIHFHGYWRGVDTLHTFDQITRDRPQLRGDLRKLLGTHNLLVIGYGGWRDVFMTTLGNIISEGSEHKSLLWSFFENDDNIIEENYSGVFQLLGPQIGGRVILYKGVDSNYFFPKLAEKLLDRARKSEISAPVSSNYTNSQATGSMDTAVKHGPTFSNAPNCDPPPSPDYWIGRTEEMRALRTGGYRVAFITGIGGQGKSCLASAFLSKENQANNISFWDWRDCREERNHIHTNLVNLCNRLSNGTLGAEELKSESDSSLVETLFRLLGETSAIIVFDNVDEYIDLDKIIPFGPLGSLVEEALKRVHNARFIFTCRPNVSLIETGSLCLPILGFQKEESLELFKHYNTNLSEEQLQSLSQKAMEKTGGHPFWLNIIAAQAVVSLGQAHALVDELSTHQPSDIKTQSDLLADRVLKAVWDRLNEKNRTLLKAMAEAVCEQSKDELAQILGKELTYNALSKSLKRLRSLNLIVTKADQVKGEFFDLHPLVRRYVRSRFTPEQRNKIIALFVAYFDGLIVGLKKQLSPKTSFSDFQNWSYKIELEINRGNYAKALETLHEISFQLEGAGYLEEYIRLSELVFSHIDWEKAVSSSLKFFDIEVCSLVEALCDLGRYPEADKYLGQLESCIHGSNVPLINLHNTRAYRYWHAEEFQKAADYASEGVRLKMTSGADINVEIEHRLALALRDTRKNESIEKALKIFLCEESINSILSPSPEDEKRLESRGMHFFGNIGRCLQFLGRNNEAMVCFKKALERGGRDDTITLNNRAYAFWWIGEIFEASGQDNIAAHFYRHAELLWLKTSPPKARKMEGLILNLAEKNPNILAVAKKDEVEIRAFCHEKI